MHTCTGYTNNIANQAPHRCPNWSIIKHTFPALHGCHELGFVDESSFQPLDRRS